MCPATRTVDAETLASLLEREHTRLRAVCVDVAAAFASGNAEAAAQLFTLLEANLAAHFRLEEEHVLPELERIDAKEARAIRADHDALRAKLAELGIGVDLHATRSEAITELMRVLDAHAAREDALAYRFTESGLSESLRARLRSEVRERSARLAERLRALRAS